MLYERGKNFLNPKSKHPGILPTQYAEYKSLIQSAPEALVKSYGLRPTNETIDRMQKVIEPIFGETKEQYKDRIIKQLESIKNEQIAISSKQLSHGFNVEGGKDSTKTPSSSSKKFNILDPQGKVVARGNADQTAAFLKDHKGYSRKSI